MSTVKKIITIGPESTGKSTLCGELAAHYQTEWCPEFAREYLSTHGNDYDFDDLLTIAKGQLAMEDEYTEKLELEWKMTNDGRWVNTHTLLTTSHPPLLFIDTDMYVMKVWCEYVFGRCHQFILDAIVNRKYDLYLLCNIDLPWVSDPLREYPGEKPRRELYSMYSDLLINQLTPWADISGDYEKRLKTAVDAVSGII